MKTVRLQHNAAAEIIPGYALPVEEWYPPEFCARCREAPDEVQTGWRYHPETDAWTPPEAENLAPTEEEDTAAMLIDHEYRLTLLEMGVTNDAV